MLSKISSFKEPISTVSNILYPIIGIFSPAHVVVALSMTLLGAASGWYHATKKRMAQDWDIRCIYLTFNAFIAAATGLWVWMGIITGIMWVLKTHINSLIAIGLQVVALILLVGAGPWLVWMAAGAVFNAPFLFTERVERWLGRTIPAWAIDFMHALWHVCTSIGMGWLILRIV